MLVFVLGAAFGPTLVIAPSRASAADSPNGVPPDPVDSEPATLVGFCEFPVLVEGGGKIKWIETGNGQLISPAPGWRTTMTNLEEPENQITVSNTGVYHVTPLPDDEELWVTTGTIFLLFDVDFTEELQQGIYLVHGRTTVVQDAEGNWDASTFRIRGQVIDVCAKLD
jgi:hypothetical protein